MRFDYLFTLNSLSLLEFYKLISLCFLDVLGVTSSEVDFIDESSTKLNITSLKETLLEFLDE